MNNTNTQLKARDKLLLLFKELEKLLGCQGWNRMDSGGVAKCGLKELVLDTKSYYGLPPTVFSADALMVLRLSGCSLRGPHRMINWPSVREFYRDKVFYNEDIIWNLKLTCPLIEKFSLVCCSGASRMIKLSGFSKLDLRGSPIAKIKNNLPSLQIINYNQRRWECQIDLIGKWDGF
ncbi:unnamed protein product [Dovyalis caffra]|uniref:Uncharacterized protein n=1 Tax=Dovyalis caffra TaxID=77055 RepID=A0AAV1RTX1_9ROSI|nr:unnamed protein product [Dovyalis caffra]